jgi:hypothetical protein
MKNSYGFLPFQILSNKRTAFEKIQAGDLLSQTYAFSSIHPNANMEWIFLDFNAFIS